MWQNAWSWGRDLIDNFSSGFNSAKNWLFDSANNVANYLSGLLHFSRPDFGPLRDYEQWMPDFMKGMAKGIENNQGEVINAANSLAGDLQNTFASNVDLAAEGSMSVSTSVNSSNTGNMADEICNGVYAAVKSAMSSDDKNTELNVYLDGDKIFSSVVDRNNSIVNQTGQSPIRV